MTQFGSAATPGSDDLSCCSTTTSRTAMTFQRDSRWHAAARWARWLAWVSLIFVVAEGALGLWQGVATGSVALTACDVCLS